MQTKVISLFFIVAIVVVAHYWISSRHINHPPHYDEMYHVLAAESYSDGGTYNILDGEYTRASLYTRIVSFTYDLFGKGLDTARYMNISLSCFMILIFMIFIYKIYNLSTAFIAGTLLSINPEIITSAHTIRFYTLHSLCFFLFSLFVFVFAYKYNYLNILKKICMLILVIVFMALAYHLQSVTVIGVIGVLIGAAIVLSDEIYSYIVTTRNSHVILLGIGIFLLAACMVVLMRSDLQNFINIYQNCSPWATMHSSNYLYYYNYFELWYPALWPLAPLLSVVSLIYYPKKTLFFLSVFVLSFAMLSFAAQKETRYVCYVIPFFIIPVSSGISIMVFKLIDAIWSLTQNNNWQYRAYILMLFVAVFIFVSTQPLFRSASFLGLGLKKDEIYYNLHQEDWDLLSNTLSKKINGEYVLITSAGVKAAYFIGNFSYDMNRSILENTDTGSDFGLDRRTGRRSIYTIPALEKVISNCYPVLFILESDHVNGIAVNEDVINVLSENGEKVDLDTNEFMVWIIDDEKNRNIQYNDNNAYDLQCEKVTIS